MKVPGRDVRLAPLFAVVLPAAFASLLCAQAPFYLHDKDTVVFYGDSITEQRLYTTFVETFVILRYPQLTIRFVNAGWGGENAVGGNGGSADTRLARDVIPSKPTVMTVMLGMNDGGYMPLNEERFHRYQAGMTHILEVTKKAFPELRVTLIEPSPYDDVTQEPLFAGGYNSVLIRYGQYVAELAKTNGMLLVDLNSPVVEMLRRATALDPTAAKTLIPGRIHPSAGAHLIMAGALLKAWSASPLVSLVEIDARAKQVSRAENTIVTKLNASETVSWSQKDAALPMIVSLRDRSLPTAARRAAPTMELALKSSDFTDTINRETLRVTGLQAAKYTLKINGSPIGSFTREQLAESINLAEFATPMMNQSVAVHVLTLKRNEIHEFRWKQLQVPLEADHLDRLPAVIDDLDKLEEDLIARRKAAAQTLVCSYELIPE